MKYYKKKKAIHSKKYIDNTDYKGGLLLWGTYCIVHLNKEPFIPNYTKWQAYYFKAKAIKLQPTSFTYACKNYDLIQTNLIRNYKEMEQNSIPFTDY